MQPSMNVSAFANVPHRLQRSIPWPGGKHEHLKWLLSHLPACNHYVEPYAGSGVVLINRTISPIETYNDLDGEVVNFFKMVRDRSEQLRLLIDDTPYSRAEYAACLTVSDGHSDLERARRFYVRVMQSYMSFAVNALPSNWGTTPNQSKNGMALAAARFKSGANAFDAMRARLKGVHFESRPATAVIAAFDDADRLFYCDPPYVTETWTRKDKSYTNVLSDDDHRDLTRILNECRGKVAISGYESALYADLYPATRWRKLLAPPKNSRASGRMRQEILWCNYGEDGERLRPTLVNGAVLEIPTSANTGVDALVSRVELAATDLWNRLRRTHTALHLFMGGAYALAAKLKDDETEFRRVMEERGIKMPNLGKLYYQIVQAFTPKDQRSVSGVKSNASRLARAFIQAETRGYTVENFVRQIERKELVGKRKFAGVDKLIRQAQSANPSQRTKRKGRMISAPDQLETGGASIIDLSRYMAIILDKARSREEQLVAMSAAADEVARAGIAADGLRVHVSAASSRETTSAKPKIADQPLQSEAKRKTRASGKARNKHEILSRSATLLPFNHPAMIEKRTIYPGKVTIPGDRRVLIEGVNNAKTGPRILKGKWKGLYVYTLTLEERTTCPSGCEHWRSCYGNNMQWAQRFAIGPALEQAIRRDVSELTTKHPAGIAVRLHVLGDFHSPAYVQLWAELLRKHATLRVFGFSRRWDVGDPIAEALRQLIQEQPERCRVRLSNAPPDLGPSTVSIEYEAPPGAIVCPAQLHKTETCSTCALCWSTEKQIAFIQH